MELCTFHGLICGKYQNQLFIYESLWDSFRPIEKVAWNGYMFQIVDDKYKKDLFDDNYGYGSLETKALCRQLSRTTELSKTTEISDPIVFWKWCGEKDVKWWYDRPCVFLNDCVPRDSNNWKLYLKYLSCKAKTLRRPVKGGFTRKHLVKK